MLCYSTNNIIKKIAEKHIKKFRERTFKMDFWGGKVKHDKNFDMKEKTPYPLKTFPNNRYQITHKAFISTLHERNYTF